MDEIKIKVNAKINLSLDITGVREDGYHTLDMLMSSIDIYDVIAAKCSKSSAVTMDGKWAPRDNTATKTLQLLGERYGIAMQVDIVKGIPFSAGMGGSSADASGVLFCASKLYGIPLEELMPIALKVGCDVPYMCYGGGARVSGVGEVVAPVEIPQTSLVVVQTMAGASTKEIYKKYDEVGGDKEGKYFNVLEKSAIMLTPDIAKAKRDLLRFTDTVFMTGSGSAYVGIFDDNESAEKCAEILRNDNIFAKAAHTQSVGIEII